MTGTFDMREAEGSLIPFACANVNCRAIIPAKTPFMADDLLSRGYCLPCGQRLRYHRRKWVERGEPMPRTFEEIETRFEKQFGGRR